MAVAPFLIIILITSAPRTHEADRTQTPDRNDARGGGSLLLPTPIAHTSHARACGYSCQKDCIASVWRCAGTEAQSIAHEQP